MSLEVCVKWHRRQSSHRYTIQSGSQSVCRVGEAEGQSEIRARHWWSSAVPLAEAAGRWGAERRRGDWRWGTCSSPGRLQSRTEAEGPASARRLRRAAAGKTAEGRPVCLDDSGRPAAARRSASDSPTPPVSFDVVLRSSRPSRSREAGGRGRSQSQAAKSQLRPRRRRCLNRRRGFEGPGSSAVGADFIASPCEDTQRAFPPAVQRQGGTLPPRKWNRTLVATTQLNNWEATVILVIKPMTPGPKRSRRVPMRLEP